jgi:hypothetical protein
MSRFAHTKRPVRRALNVEALDDRVVPSVSAISSSFNATPIAPDSTVWFSSVIKVTGPIVQTTSVHVDGGTITAPDFTVQVPSAVVTFTPLALSTVTTFDSATNTWHTMAPSTGLNGNVFLAGVALPVPNGLPGGENPVTWRANFTSETPGLNVSWKWSAAVYSNFNTNMNALGVRASDGLLGGLLGSRPAGTPQNYTAYLVAGARSNGGSNFTGTYSGTQSTNPDQAPPPTGISLSGSVYLDDDWSGARDNGEPGIEGAVLHLSGFDLQGNEVTQTVTTDADGHYTFSNLPAGTYQIMEDQPRYIDAWESVGTVNGETRGEILDNDLIGNITLGIGDVGVGYDFAEILNMPG